MEQESTIVKLLTQSRAIQYVSLAISIIGVVVFLVWFFKKEFKKSNDIKDLKSSFQGQSESKSKLLFV